MKHLSVTVHSQLVFEFDVTIFGGTWGARYLHLPGACVDVEILIPLCCCRLQSICQCLIDMDQRYEGVCHFKSRRSVCCARNQRCFSFGGSANQIDRLSRLEGLNGSLFSSTQFSEKHYRSACFPCGVFLLISRFCLPSPAALSMLLLVGGHPAFYRADSPLS